MIKDKFTSGLKKVISSTIDISERRNKERGFLLCEDRKTGKLFSSQICEGTTCELPPKKLNEGISFCYKNNADPVGDFHTHIYVRDANIERIKEGKPRISANELKRKIEDNYKHAYGKLGIKISPSVLIPSYYDLLSRVRYMCRAKDLGIDRETVCIGSDLDKDKIECWTTKNKELNKDICDKADEEHKPENIEKRYKDRMKKFDTDHLPEPWQIPLFEKEIVDL